MTQNKQGKAVEQQYKASFEDLREAALKHYDEASSAIHHWSSFVVSAIKAYHSSPNQTPSPQPGNEGQEWKKKADEFWEYNADHPSQSVIDWIEQNVVTPLQSQLQAREKESAFLNEKINEKEAEIKRLTPTTQSAEEVVTNAYEAGRKFGNAQKDGTPPYNWPASITEYLEQFKNKSK
jgi:hypothetical protein